MSFFCEFVSPIGICQRPLRVPVVGRVGALFILFRSGPVGLRGEFMLQGGFSV